MYVYVSARVCTTACVWKSDNNCGHCSHFHFIGTSGQIEVTGLGGKGHYHPSHYSSPYSHFKTAKSATTVTDRECYSYSFAVTFINLGVPDGDI